MKYLIYLILSIIAVSFIIHQTEDSCKFFKNKYNLPEKSLNGECLVKYKEVWVPSKYYLKYAREPWRN